MPKTMEYLKENFSGDEYRMRLDLIKRGMKAGRDELIKITKKYLLQVPIVLLVLCNRKRGPSFLRAVLSVLYENREKAEPQILIHDAENEEKWGRFKYSNAEERPDEEKVWYNLLTQSEEQVNDLIHWWRQLCMSFEVLTEDLQNLSRVSEVQVLSAGEGAPLIEFKTNYPVLYYCLYSVFGTMLSNSRLCEQVHGMMRHGLRKEIGMDQADHQRVYNSGIDHEMKEARRMLATNVNIFRNKHKKAAEHSRTKEQLVFLSKQVSEQADAMQKSMKNFDMALHNIPTVNQISIEGRRKMDKENLTIQMMREDEKADALRRDEITPDKAAELGRNTTLTNDVSYVADAKLRRWHERVPELLKKKTWDKPAGEEMTQYLIKASKNFRFWHHSKDPEELKKIKTKKEAKKMIDEAVDFALKFGKDILKYAECMPRRPEEHVETQGLKGFVDESVHRSDILSVGLCWANDDTDEEVVMEPAEELLVKRFKVVDAHFDTIAGESDESDDEMNEGDGVDAINDVADDCQLNNEE